MPNVETPSSILLKPTKTPDVLVEDVESTGSLPSVGTRTVTESTPTTEPRRTEAEIRKPKKLKAYARVEGQSQARVGGGRLGAEPRRTEAEIRKPKKLKAYAKVVGRSQARVAAVAQERPAAPPAAGATEPIQFRLADRGN